MRHLIRRILGRDPTSVSKSPLRMPHELATPVTEPQDSASDATANAHDETIGWFTIDPLCDPRPLPTDHRDIDTVRVWLANEPPPERRQPSAEEHAIELLGCLRRHSRMTG